MRRAIAPLILLLFVLAAGCEIEKDQVDEPLDPSLHLTDGFCLIKDSRVVLNHYDIDFYDYSAHMIYLKSPDVFVEEFKYMDAGTIYADSSRIYDLSFVSHAASYIPQGPVIYFPSIFFPSAFFASAFFSSGFSATMAWVVSINEATLAAFCNANRTTLVGSIIPAFIRSS